MIKWYRQNVLQVNIKKYQSMVLGKRNGTEGINMYIGGVKTEQVSKYQVVRNR